MSALTEEGDEVTARRNTFVRLGDVHKAGEPRMRLFGPPDAQLQVFSLLRPSGVERRTEGS